MHKAVICSLYPAVFLALFLTPLPAWASSTPVNITSVVPSPRTIGYQAQYTINIDLAADGGLLGGTDIISVIFPSNTVVTDGALANVSVEGTPAWGASGDSTLRRIDITPGQDLPGGTTAVTLVIPSAAVRNPTLAGTYTLNILTTLQPVGTSPGYSINPPPTPTFTFTRTATRTRTFTRTATPTFTHTPTSTISPTPTVTPTITLTATPSPTLIATPTTTPTPYLLSPETTLAYPSPAAGNDLWFSYATSAPADVTVEIHAVTGERIHTIPGTAPAAGTWRIYWNIEDVAPGVYLYRVLYRYAGKSSATSYNKFVIIKR